MKKEFLKKVFLFFILTVLLFPVQISSAAGAEKVQYGGTLTYLDQSPSSQSPVLGQRRYRLEARTG